MLDGAAWSAKGSCSHVAGCIAGNASVKRIIRGLVNPTLSDAESASICRIQAHLRVFDWTQPPNNTRSMPTTGTGFMLDAFPPSDTALFVVTAHHVVENSVQVRVNFARLGSEYVEATVVGANPVMDCALLAVEDPALLRSLRNADAKMLTRGDSDRIKPPAGVTACGFALGSSHMQATKGVLSGRLEGPSRLQTDVAVNGGNSGGPLLCESNQVIGLVQSGLLDAQGINYAVPIHEATVALARVLDAWLRQDEGARQPIREMPLSFNASFTRCNRILCNTVHGCKAGMLCTGVHPLVEFPQTRAAAFERLRRNGGEDAEDAAVVRLASALRSVRAELLQDEMDRERWFLYMMRHCTGDVRVAKRLVDLIRNDSLRAGDVVTQLSVTYADGGAETFDVDLQMTAKYEFWGDRIGVGAILDRLSAQDALHMQVYRGSRFPRRVAVPLAPSYDVYRQMHSDTEPIPYMVLGGVFVMPLLHNHERIFRREPLSTLMGRPQSRHWSVLIITHMMPESPFNECESIGPGDVLVAINGETVRSVRACEAVWERELRLPDAHAVTLETRNGTVASACVRAIKTANAQIVATYNSERYAGYHT